MRPLELIMTGFGPYGGTARVDFEALGEHGIFLITGDTGAGKTTIFDGISFALFGEASGDNRSAGMLRSDFAGPECRTEVTLVFRHRGTKYTIHRTPSYLRAKQRGKGLTKETQDARIDFGTQSVSGYGQVTEFCRELLGLDKQQFSQVAMLAQGDFMKLLLSGTEERGRIFRKIFGTGFCRELQDRLKERASKSKSEYELCRHSLLQARASLSFENDSIPDGEILSAAEETLRLTESALNDLQTEIASLEKDLRRAENAREKYQRAQALESSLAELVKRAETAEARYADAAARAETAAKRQPQTDRLKWEIALFEKSIPDYALLDEALNGLRRLEQLTAEREAFLREHPDLPSPDKALSDRDAALKAAEDLRQFRLLEESCRKAQEAFLAAEEACETQTRISDRAEKLFLREQAGILAETLADGIPCPVCGATEHPRKAARSPEAPSQAELEEEKARTEAARQDRETASRRAGELAAARKQAQGALTVRSPEEAEARRRAAEECLTAAREKEILDQQWQESRAKAAALKERADSIRKTLPFPEKKEALQTISRKKRELEAEQKAIEEAKKQLTLRAEERTALQASAGERREQLRLAQEEYLPLADCLTEENALAEQKLHLKEKDQQRQTYCAVLLSDRKTYEKLQALMKDLSRITGEYSAVRQLADAAAGTIPGQNKMTFESYLQAFYFQEIIARSNLWLERLSSGRFQLHRMEEASDKRSQSGLELEVLDHYTGKYRNVRTLSGGESFMASLSLALGLSDTVQAYAGGVTLETMFIDEGFGTLDADSLDKALQVLDGLAGSARLIGIISHVEELGSRIPRQISVTRSVSGESQIRVRTS